MLQLVIVIYRYSLDISTKFQAVDTDSKKK